MFCRNVHVCTLLKMPDCSTSDSMMLNMYVTVILTRLGGWLQPLYSISHLQKSYTTYLHSILRCIINQYQICSVTLFARIKLSFTLSRCFDVIKFKDDQLLITQPPHYSLLKVIILYIKGAHVPTGTSNQKMINDI